jgi:hypothetical protein
MNTQQILQIPVQAAKVEQRRTWQGINQNINVAALQIVTSQHRAKQTRIGNRIARDKRTHRVPFLFKSL